jgi:hypothetical protein
MAILGPFLGLLLLAFPFYAKAVWYPYLFVFAVPLCALFRVKGVVFSVLALGFVGYAAFLVTPLEERFFLALETLAYAFTFLITSFTWERVYYGFRKREKEAKNRLYHLRLLDEKIKALKADAKGELADLLSKVVAYKRQIEEQKTLIRTKEAHILELQGKLQETLRERQLFEVLLKQNKTTLVQ